MKIAAIVGPTGVGKTEISIYTAKALNAEIISCDSMQVYKGMDIGTAKITKDEMQGVKHWLLDIADPRQNFSVCNFTQMCKSAAEDISSRGKLPLIVGGTGLYVDSFVNGAEFCDQKSDIKYRKELENIAKNNGAEYLHKMLEKADKKSAEKIHTNNVKRVIRALEYHHLTGSTISQHNEQDKLRPPAYDCMYIGLTRNRDELYKRIDMRVDKMLAGGLLDEVKKLVGSGIKKNCTAMQALGYKELLWYMHGLLTYGEAVRILKRDSRHYAKRQLTWFNRNKNIHWINLSNYSHISDAAHECETVINNFLKG